MLQQGDHLRMGQGQGITVGEEQGGMTPAPGGGKIEIRLDLRPGFDPEGFGAIGAAEGAAVVGAAGGHLEDQGKGLAGRPDDVSLIIHGQEEGPVRDNRPRTGLRCDQPFFLAKSAMKPTSLSTPSLGKAL